MKIVKNMAAQGDFVIIRINELPANIEQVKADQGKFTVAHSETGHNHVMLADRVTAFKPKDVDEVDLYEMFLDVKDPTEIVHLRDFDTHESIQVPAGTWRILRQREHTAEGFRRAQD